MTTDKDKIDWYLKEHTRIIAKMLEALRNEPQVRALVIDRGPWEDWLRDANIEAYMTYQRVRETANKLWAAGSDDPLEQARFSSSLETEHQLALWAAKEFLKWQEKAKALKDIEIREVLHAGNTRYE